MGPVHLAIPSDLWSEGPAPRSDFERTRAFAGAMADDEGLCAAAELLADAQRPVLMFGSEVGQYAGAAAAAVRLAESLGAPVVIDDQPAYLAFPTTHAQYVGKRGPQRALIAAADVVLAVGIEFTEIGVAGEPPPFPPSAQLTALSVDSLLPTR